MRSSDTTDELDRLQADTLLVRSRRLLASELGPRETVMLDIEQGTYFGVEGVARFIWDALEDPVTLRDVTSMVRARYPEAQPEVCERDTREFVEDLLRHRLVQLHARRDDG